MVRARRGYTLIEVVVAMAIMTLIASAVGSAMVVASRAMPAPDSPAEALVAQAGVLEELTTDLMETATFTALDPERVVFLVPDRNSDAAPELIAWERSGSGDNPLEKSLNGGMGSAALDSTHAFDLAYNLRQVNTTYPGPITPSSTQTLINFDNTGSFSESDIEEDRQVSQWIQPTLPADATAWRITHIELECKTNGSTDGVLLCHIRDGSSDGEPGSTVYQAASTPESAMSASYTWHPITFSWTVDFAPGDGVCVFFGRGSGNVDKACTYRWQDKTGTGLAFNNDESKPAWMPETNGTIDLKVFGTYDAPGPDQTLTREFVTGVEIELQKTNDARTRTRTAVEPLNRPENLDAYLLADFAGDPTAVDLDADGVGDWRRSDAQVFNTASLVSGSWAPDAILESSTEYNFDTPTLVRARWETTSGGNGTFVSINGAWDGVNHTDLKLVLTKSGVTQTLRLDSRVSGVSYATLETVTGLPAGWVDAELLIDPSYGTARLRVDGQQVGTYTYQVISNAGAEKRVYLGTNGSSGVVDFVEVRVLP